MSHPSDSDSISMLGDCLHPSGPLPALHLTISIIQIFGRCQFAGRLGTHLPGNGFRRVAEGSRPESRRHTPPLFRRRRDEVGFRVHALPGSRGARARRSVLCPLPEPAGRLGDNAVTMQASPRSNPASSETLTWLRPVLWRWRRRLLVVWRPVVGSGRCHAGAPRA